MRIFDRVATLLRCVAMVGVAGLIAACGGGSSDQPGSGIQAADAAAYRARKLAVTPPPAQGPYYTITDLTPTLQQFAGPGYSLAGPRLILNDGRILGELSLNGFSLTGESYALASAPGSVPTFFCGKTDARAGFDLIAVGFATIDSRFVEIGPVPPGCSDVGTAYRIPNGVLEARGLNSLQQAVGTYFLPATGERRATLYANGAVTLLQAPVGVTTLEANGINDQGTIVGWGQVSNCTADCAHPLLFNGASWQDLSPLVGPGGQAYGINNRGQVIGTTIQGSTANTAGWLLDGNVKADIPPIAAGFAMTPRVLNSFGVVVGNASLAPSVVPFIYFAGTSYDINALVEQGTGWQILAVTDLNDLGQMVGQARAPDGTLRAMRLDPTGVNPLPRTGYVPAAPGPCSLSADPSTPLPIGGGQVTLTATCIATGGTPTLYSWTGSFSNGPITSTTSAATGNVTESTTFSVVASSAAGSSAPASATVTVAPTPPPTAAPGPCTVSASPSTPLPFGGGQVTITAACSSSGGTPTSYSWTGSFSNGPITTTSDFVTGNVAQTTAFSVVASNVGGSSLPAGVTVIVAPLAPPPPSPTIATIYPSSGPAGTSVTIIGTNFGALQNGSCSTLGPPQDTSFVIFGSNPATTIIRWCDSQIDVVAPANGRLIGPVSIIVQVGGQTSNESAFAYTTATKVEKKCEKSLLNLKYWAFYKNTCELVDLLRREFLISSQDASTDALYDWLKSTNRRTGLTNEAGLIGLGAYLDYGRSVAAFYVGGPLPAKSSKKFGSEFVKAADTLTGVLGPVLDLIELTPAQFLVGNMASSALVIVQGLKTFEFGKKTLVAADARYVFQGYVALRDGPRLSLEAVQAQVRTDYEDSMRRAICILEGVTATSRCDALSSDENVIKGYLAWLEAQYIARSLFIASPEQRDAIGNAIAKVATRN